MRTYSHSILLATVVALSSATAVIAQEERSSSSQYLVPQPKPHVSIPFFLSDEGKRFEPIWGLDQAWISEQNLRKGVNHMGKENVGIGRSAFRFTKPLVNDTTLADEVRSVMQQRNTIFNIVDPSLPIVFTADQEAGTDEYYVKNKSANIEHWAAMINSHVHWMQKFTSHPIVGVSPFNEPDCWTEEEGATTAKQRDVAKLLKENYPRFADIAIVGGNTLNNDKAWEWYESGRQYYDWGNTHQLAGSFDTFASFFKQVSDEGKVGFADEMHNVGEAMVGLEYGMTVGIWWGFDSRARGEFCQISRHGTRLAYDEHRSNWTAASVYRHDDGRVKAFVGSSERQAVTTTYQFVSPERDVYYDGYGPVREFIMEMPGGTGYWIGQANAERVIDITWGEDVAPRLINGTYKIVNKATGNVAAVSGNNIVQQKNTSSKAQQWNVHPCDPRIGGDYSFIDIESVQNSQLRMNVLNFSTQNNTNVMAYSQNEKPSSNEQWYLEYAGNGYYYVRNRETALCLTSASDTKTDGTNVTTFARYADNDSKRSRQLWRFLPLDVDYETKAPAQPTGLIAEANVASVKLSWTMGTEEDIEGYMILRAPSGTDDWNTIARYIKTSYFVDNTCQQQVAYQYKIKAIDKAENLSKASETAEATPTGEPSLIARWHFDGNTNDETPNMMDAALAGKVEYVNDHKSGEQALRFNYTQSNFLQLPYEIANSDELTFAAWVNVRNSSKWQRIFDFGNSTEQYMFLTPNNGSKMRFVIKNKGDEQIVEAPSLQNMQWRHVAVSIGKDKTTIYVDGVEAGSSTGITIKPSDIHPVLNYIGRSQYTSDPFFTGYIDDVQIYNYALDAEAVQKVMSDTANGIDSPTGKGSAPHVVYDLGGRRVNPSKTAKGIRIVDGKLNLNNQ